MIDVQNVVAARLVADVSILHPSRTFAKRRRRQRAVEKIRRKVIITVP